MTVERKHFFMPQGSYFDFYIKNRTLLDYLFCSRTANPKPGLCTSARCFWVLRVTSRTRPDQRSRDKANITGFCGNCGKTLKQLLYFPRGTLQRRRGE